MNVIFKILIFALFFHQTVSGEDTCSRRSSHQNTETCTKVVDHTFCENNMPRHHTTGTQKLQEHCVTRAVLTNDVMYPDFFFENLLRQPYIQM